MNRFSETTFKSPTTASAMRGLVWFHQVTGEINMSQDGERPHSDTWESFQDNL